MHYCGPEKAVLIVRQKSNVRLSTREPRENWDKKETQKAKLMEKVQKGKWEVSNKKTLSSIFLRSRAHLYNVV